MPMKVLTYADPTKLLEYPGELLKQKMIYATPSLKIGIVGFFGEQGSVRENGVIARDVLGRLLDPWLSERTRLAQYARLTRLLEELKAQVSKDLLPHLQAFRRNQRDLLQAIRLVEEAGLLPADLKPKTLDEQLFQRVWDAFAKHPSIQTLRDNFRLFTQQPDAFRQALEQAFGYAVAKQGEDPYPWQAGPVRIDGPLLFHGFYFITPIQLRLMQLCDAAGIDVQFLCCVDKRYRETHRSWYRFFDPVHGLPGEASWSELDAVPPELPTYRRVLAELLEDRRPSLGPGGPRLPLLKYPGFSAFVRQFVADHPPAPITGGAMEGDSTPVYVSPQAPDANRFLREYYPGQVDQASRQLVQERHFLSYPLGQFLLHLHQLYDETDQQLKIEARPLAECFASGWLQVGKLNGRHYLRQLEALLPFFQGCSTLVEWRERAKLLREIREGVVSQFDTPVAPHEPNHRFHQYLLNPLERFTHFRVPSKEVAAATTLMERLFELGEQLFGPGDITLKEHFDRIETLIVAGVDRSELLPVETLLLDGLKERLANVQDPNERFLTQDLAGAIALYLGGDLDDPEDPQTLDPNHLVMEWDRLDGYPLMHRSRERDGKPKSGRPLHLCLLSESSLPARRSPYPWPLSRETLRHLEHRPTVRMLALREEESVSADRFLFHQALAWAEDLILSWVVDWQERVHGPSPYLTLMAPYCQQKEVELKPWSPGAPSLVKRLDLTVRPDPEAYELLPPDAVAEAVLCPRRFGYSFLAQPAPTFHADFHHRFLFGNLAKGLASATGISVEKVAVQMAPLFPQFSPLLQRDLLESAPRPWEGSDRYDGHLYARARAPLHLLKLGGDDLQVVRRVLASEDAQDDQKEVLAEQLQVTSSLPPATPGTHCRFCPYSDRCDQVQYAVDDE